MPDDVLLFDLGGVLIETALFPLLRRIAPQIEGDDIYDRWLESEAVARFERGSLNAEAFAAAFVREWALDMAPDDFMAAFATSVKGPFPGALDLLDRLRPQYVLACLSNCNSIHWPLIEGVADRFDHVFVSHLCGLVKPDPEVFQHVLRGLGRPPAAVRFFDDSLKNVMTAQAAGIQAHHTVGFQALEQTMTALGLLATT